MSHVKLRQTGLPRQSSDGLLSLGSREKLPHVGADANQLSLSQHDGDDSSEASAETPRAEPSSPKALDSDAIERVAGWIEDVLSEERPQKMDFFSWLRDGQILCEVMRSLFADSIPKINYSPIAHKQLENLQTYLAACRAHRVFPLFVPDDLFHSRNLPLVLANIDALFLAATNTATTAASATAPTSTSAAAARSLLLTVSEPCRGASSLDAGAPPARPRSPAAGGRMAVPLDEVKELSRWALSTIKEAEPTLDVPVVDNDDQFYDLFADGSLLCRLCNALRPGTVAKVDPCPVPFSQASSLQKFRAHDNLERYLLACRTVFALSEEECFVPSQLTERKDLAKVLTNIFSLRTRINRSAGAPLAVTPLARRRRGHDAPTPAKSSSSNDIDADRLVDRLARRSQREGKVTARTRSATDRMVDFAGSSGAPSPRRDRSLSTSRGRPSSTNSYKLLYPGHYAARKGYVTRLQALSDEALSKPDSRNRCPLHLAASENQVEAIEFLCAKLPGQMEALDQNGHTPLLLACSVGAFAAAKWLLLNGASATAANQSGLTCLHLLVKLSSSSKERNKLIKLLLSHGGAVDQCDSYGESALFYAASHLSVSTVKLLRKRGASFFMRNQFGETPLHKACRLLNSSPKSSRAMITLLIANGVDATVEGAHGTALSLVDRAQHPDVYQQLHDAMLARADDASGSGRRSEWAQTVCQSVSLEALRSTATLLDGMQRIEEIAKLSGDAPSSGATAAATATADNDEEEQHWLLRLPTAYKDDDDDDFDDSGSLLSSSSSSSSSSAPSSPLIAGGGAQLRSPVLKSAPARAIAVECPGYRVENGSESAKSGVYKLNCGYLKLPPVPYHQQFFGKIHTNFFGFFASGKPFVVSILDNATGSGDVPNYRGLLRTPSVEKAFWLPMASSSKTKGGKMRQLLCLLIEQYSSPEIFNNASFFQLPSEKTQRDLSSLETQDPLRSTCFPIGVVFAKKDQVVQWDMWANEEGSPAWDRFLSLLGNQVTLRGWSGYTGGLDTQSDSKGKYSVFTEFEGLSIMFHVSTMLPFDPLDPQKLQRSRVIGNDVAMIIFQEDAATSYFPSCMTGQVSHIFIVVRPVALADGSPAYEVACVSKDFVAPFKPRLPSPNVVPEKDVRKWLLTKLINGFVCAQQSPGLSMMYCRPRQHLMTDMINSLSPQAKERFVVRWDAAAKKAKTKKGSIASPLPAPAK